MKDATEAVRSFNRFFTRHAGALDSRFLDSDANLSEARLLFEIARLEPVTAIELQVLLGLDRGHLSRLASRFEERGWVVRDKIKTDGRSRLISLTRIGRKAFEEIDERQRSIVADALSRLDMAERDDLVRSLARTRLLLDPTFRPDPEIRPARTGEASEVAARQSILYAASHGWGRPLEILEAETAAAFLRDFKPGREQCWIADLASVIAGAVFLTDEGSGSARLRLLHVEPFARGRGIGDSLVRTCVGFAREIGYDRLVLWTHAVLEPARRLYARQGFERVSSEVHHAFGTPVLGETWQLDLRA